MAQDLRQEERRLLLYRQQALNMTRKRQARLFGLGATLSFTRDQSASRVQKRLDRKDLAQNTGCKKCDRARLETRCQIWSRGCLFA